MLVKLKVATYGGAETWTWLQPTTSVQTTRGPLHASELVVGDRALIPALDPRAPATVLIKDLV